MAQAHCHVWTCTGLPDERVRPNTAASTWRTALTAARRTSSQVTPKPPLSILAVSRPTHVWHIVPRICTRRKRRQVLQMRIITFAFLFGLVACFPTLSMGAPGDVMTGCSGSQLEIDTCVQGKLKAADHSLNEIYGVVMKELSAGPSTDDPQDILVNSEIQRTLIGAERQWVKFRDAQCAAESALIGTGTAAPAVTGHCLLGLTQERIRFLRRVADQMHWDSKLCRANRASCVLPTVPP